MTHNSVSASNFIPRRTVVGGRQPVFLVYPILAICGIVENCKKKAFFLNASVLGAQWKESKDDDGVSNRRDQLFSCEQQISAYQ